jgi:hypothetical protein
MVNDAVQVVCWIFTAAHSLLKVLVRLRRKQLTQQEVRWPMKTQMML